MPRTVNVVLPDGRVVSVPEDVANRLSAAGNVRVETPEEAAPRNIAAAEEKTFGTLEHKIGATFEGFLSGASVGLLDPLITTEQTQARARVNPGYRGLGEVAGALLPSIAAPESLLAKTPAGMVARGASAVAKDFGGLKSVKGLAAAGGIEGMFQGAGGAISHATLSDDPLTVEAVLHGAGRGALLGFGIGNVAGGLAKIGRKAAQLEQKAALIETKTALEADPEAFTEMSGKLKSITRDAHLEAEMGGQWKGVPAYDQIPQDKGIKMVVKAGDLRGAEAVGNINPAKVERFKGMRAQGLQGAPPSLSVSPEGGLSVVDGKHRLASFADNEDILVRFDRGRGGAVPPYSGPSRLAADLKVPKTLEEFASWQPAKVADWVNSAQAGGIHGARALETMADYASRFGLKVDDAAEAVVGLHNAVRAVGQAERKSAGWFSNLISRTGKTAGGRMAQSLAGKGEPIRSLAMQAGRLGGGYLVGGPMGVIAEAFGLRAAVTNRVRAMVAKYGETGGQAFGKLAPVTARLANSMSGEAEDGDIRDLAVKRAEDLYRMGPVAPDAAYAVGAPIVPTAGPDFAHALANNLTSGVQYLLGFAPKDPGTAHSMGKSDWRPSYDQAEELASRLEAADDPWAAIERQLSGEGDAAGAEALWSLWPATMQELQLEITTNANKLQDLPFDKVMALSSLTRTQLDGLLLPQHVAALQSNFIPGNMQSESGPSRGTGGAPGRPASSTPPSGGTMVQNLTAR